MTRPKSLQTKDMDAKLEEIRAASRRQIEANKRIVRASGTREDAPLTRSYYAYMRSIALAAYGSTIRFPRILDVVTPQEAMNFLLFHVLLVRALKTNPMYVHNYRSWIFLQKGRLPLHARRYIVGDYKGNILLRELERLWASEGGVTLDPQEIYEEMDHARAQYPQATCYAELCEADGVDAKLASLLTASPTEIA